MGTNLQHHTRVNYDNRVEILIYTQEVISSEDMKIIQEASEAIMSAASKYFVDNTADFTNTEEKQ